MRCHRQIAPGGAAAAAIRLAPISPAISCFPLSLSRLRAVPSVSPAASPVLPHYTHSYTCPLDSAPTHHPLPLVRLVSSPPLFCREVTSCNKSQIHLPPFFLFVCRGGDRLCNSSRGPRGAGRLKKKTNHGQTVHLCNFHKLVPHYCNIKG